MHEAQSWGRKDADGKAGWILQQVLEVNQMGANLLSMISIFSYQSSYVSIQSIRIISSEWNKCKETELYLSSLPKAWKEKSGKTKY